MPCKDPFVFHKHQVLLSITEVMKVTNQRDQLKFFGEYVLNTIETLIVL